MPKKNNNQENDNAVENDIVEDDIVVEDDITVEDIKVENIETDLVADAIPLEEVLPTDEVDIFREGGVAAESLGEKTVSIEKIQSELYDSYMFAGFEELFSESVDNSHRVASFTNKLTAFSSMYKVDVNVNDFVLALSDAWTLMKSGDTKKREVGKNAIGEQFKNILQASFEVEKNAAYKEHRIPEFNEIIKSTNDVFRSAMYAFTDLYHDPNSAALFEQTAFGGLNAKEMAKLTEGESLWKMDQKSDEAWEIQSREAKDIAEQWLKEDKPYEKMINEMNGLIESMNKGILGMKETYAKLTAAEWLLVNNEKMMVENPEDPLNPIPNWGNRYWKAIIQAREAVGISKYTSMRELIQGNYAEIAKAVVSTNYNERQIDEFVLNPEVREVYDSLEAQKVEFATQSAAFFISEPPKENVNDKVAEEDYIRKREPVESENERIKQKNEPRVWSNMVVDSHKELKIDATRENVR